MTMNWNEYFINMAMLVAKKSKDPSTKVGCVFVGKNNQVLSTGFNGFPRGIAEDEPETAFDTKETEFGFIDLPVKKKKLIAARWERPIKYSYVEHAERNAIYNAARHGVSLDGAKVYMNFEPTCMCEACTRALIQVGVTEVIGPNISFSGKGSGTHYTTGQLTQEMMSEAGIVLRTIPWGD